jgi:AcrR family transcriptional regulator
MAWDTEGTKRKILEAATVEFARRGPDGTTIEQIAKLAGVNKERVYNYFGSKPALFAYVLREQSRTWVSTPDGCTTTTASTPSWCASCSGKD